MFTISSPINSIINLFYINFIKFFAMNYLSILFVKLKITRIV
jgi:hypothetical protein